MTAQPLETGGHLVTVCAAGRDSDGNANAPDALRRRFRPREVGEHGVPTTSELFADTLIVRRGAESGALTEALCAICPVHDGEP